MLITGYIRDKHNNPTAGANITAHNKYFEILYSAVADDNGFCTLELPAGRHPYMAAVRQQ